MCSWFPSPNVEGANEDRSYTGPRSHQQGGAGWDHEIVELRSLGQEKYAQQAHYTGCRASRLWHLWGSDWYNTSTLNGRGAQESWLIFKDHLSQAQEWSIPTKKLGKSARRPREQGAPGQIQKESLQRVEARTSNLGGIQRNGATRDQVGKLKPWQDQIWPGTSRATTKSSIDMLVIKGKLGKVWVPSIRKQETWLPRIWRGHPSCPVDSTHCQLDYK